MSDTNKSDFNHDFEKKTESDRRSVNNNIINIQINGNNTRLPEVSDKSRLVTLILFFFLPTLHRVYAGKILTAILFFITAGGLGIWWIIDFYLIVTGGFRDSNGDFVRNW